MNSSSSSSSSNASTQSNQSNQSNLPDAQEGSSNQERQAVETHHPFRQAGQMRFPDSMPHVSNEDGYLINQHGDAVPPMRQNGTAGSNETTWLAGKPIIEENEPAE